MWEFDVLNRAIFAVMTGEIVITALFSASHLSHLDLDELVAQCAT
jgi:hypothetical protein